MNIEELDRLIAEYELDLASLRSVREIVRLRFYGGAPSKKAEAFIAAVNGTAQRRKSNPSGKPSQETVNAVLNTIAAAGRPMTGVEIARAIRKNDSTVYAALGQLRREEAVTKTTDGYVVNAEREERRA